jgi:hypothetical protein
MIAMRIGSGEGFARIAAILVVLRRAGKCVCVEQEGVNVKGKKWGVSNGTGWKVCVRVEQGVSVIGKRWEVPVVLAGRHVYVCVCVCRARRYASRGKKACECEG